MTPKHGETRLCFRVLITDAESTLSFHFGLSLFLQQGLATFIVQTHDGFFQFSVSAEFLDELKSLILDNTCPDFIDRLDHRKISWYLIYRLF